MTGMNRKDRKRLEWLTEEIDLRSERMVAMAIALARRCDELEQRLEEIEARYRRDFVERVTGERPPEGALGEAWRDGEGPLIGFDQPPPPPGEGTMGSTLRRIK